VDGYPETSKTMKQGPKQQKEMKKDGKKDEASPYWCSAYPGKGGCTDSDFGSGSVHWEWKKVEASSLGPGLDGRITPHSSLVGIAFPMRRRTLLPSLPPIKAGNWHGCGPSLDVHGVHREEQTQTFHFLDQPRRNNDTTPMKALDG
jgi:hypothetical protein